MRWTGFLVPLYSETYTLTTISDDGVRLIVNNQPIVDNWTDHSQTQNVGVPITLVAGKHYAITVEYYQGGGAAIIQLLWQSQSQQQQIIPQSQLFPS